MTTLLLVEWRRLAARRLVRVLVVLAALAIAVTAVIVFLVSRPTDQATLDAGERARQAAVEQCLAGEGEAAGIPEADREFACNQVTGPAVDRRFHYQDVPEILLGLSPLAVILGWLVGATAIGAEWHAGTVTTLLTWEPRRVRVLAAKTAAAGVLAVVLSAALLALVAVVLLPAGQWRGTMAGVDLAWLRGLVGVVARSSAVAGLSAVLGFALAVIGRNTAAALGIGFAYLAVVESIVRGVRPGWSRWLLGDNAALVITNQPADFPTVGRTTLEAAVLLAAYAAALVALALVAFRQRDIT